MTLHDSTRHLALVAGSAIALGLAAPDLEAQQAASADPSAPINSFGVELQAYPAGLIVTGHFQARFGITNEFYASLGYNVTDRRNWGEHENEEGGGPGGGVAVRHHFQRARTGWFAEGRLELWSMDIDWTDAGGARSGRTEMTVLQPTGAAGYTWLFDRGNYRLSAAAALGAEINLRTRGEDVGQGAIVLGRVALSRGY